MMRKIGIGMFCVALCLAVALVFPKVGTSYLYVDTTGCACHDFSGGAGLHTGTTHTSAGCTACHAVVGDSPLTSTCIVCHPAGDTGACPLVNVHSESCLSCHDECAEETTTTTTADETSTTTSEGETSTTTTVKEGCALVKIYGEGSDEVAVMRYLRDNVLSTSEAGQEIIRLYYMWSPVIASAAQGDDEVKEELKEMVDGILGLVLAEPAKVEKAE